MTKISMPKKKQTKKVSALKVISRGISADIGRLTSQAKAKAQAKVKAFQDKSALVNSLTNKELRKVAINFISSNPKIKFTDDKGKMKSREPTRKEYVKAIMKGVSVMSIRGLLKK